MEDKLISLETAKLAKELRFDYKTYNYFQIQDDSFSVNEFLALEVNSDFYKDKPVVSLHKNHNNSENFISRPTQSLLQSWLREVHHYHISVIYVDDLLKYGCKITNVKTNTELFEIYKNNYFELGGYEYSEALETGLIEALKTIKNDQ